MTNNSGYGTTDATSGSVLNYNTMTYNSAYDDTNTANNISWGLVSHLPKALRAQLPLDTDISLHYDRGQNVRSEIRYGFSGNRLPNASGNTEEYGFTIDTLNDKVQFKMTWYDTKVKNANMADTTGQNGTLGSNTYELYMLPTWGTVHALTARAGLAGQLTTYDANGAVVSNSASWAWDWVGNSGSNATWLWKSNNDPLSAAYKADPGVKAEQAAVDDWFKYMNMGQTWYDNYGYKFSSSAWAASDWANIIPGNDVSSPNVGGLQSSGGGRIRGTFPIGTIDNESKGVELEVTAQPFKGLSLTMNASRTDASQTKVDAEFVGALTDLYNRLENTHAGDMRLWWAGDTDTIGQRFLADLWAPYQFQVETNGKQVSEVSKWRYNAVANYSFDERLFNGRLKGLNVGAGYRWQKAPVIGYLLTKSTDAAWIKANLTSKSNLDINLPVYGSSESNLDLWVGYSRQLTKKLNWNIQVNLRNVGQKAHLDPISVEPLLNSDGSYNYANYRIKDGTQWTVTNTFSF